jgi:ubiquinol-cytochrome c reductase cytochrome c1 subunit
MENAPDLSLMAKARAGFHGPYGTGHQPAVPRHGRAGIHLLDPDRLYRRGKGRAGFVLLREHAFPGGWIAMAPPLSDDQVALRGAAAFGMPFRYLRVRMPCASGM